MKVSGLCIMCEAVAYVFFCELFCEYFYVLNEQVKWISSEEDVVHIMSYLCSWKKVDAVKTMYNGKATEVSVGSLAKVHCVRPW